VTCAETVNKTLRDFIVNAAQTPITSA